ncbi:MAG: DMT family transporter [Gammaproteobacteria bacterium]|nr:DMT family transporter [Gammaproteobacteria bacterium]
MSFTNWGLLVFLSVLWGSAFFFVGIAVIELPPLTIVLVRVGLAALFLLPLLFYLGYSLPKGLTAWTPFVVMGFLNNVLPFSFLNTGQTMVSVGLASIINALTPLFTVLVMASFKEERLTVYRMIGVLFGVLGVVQISLTDLTYSSMRIVGIGLCMAGAFSYAFAALWGRRYLVKHPPLVNATCQLLSSTLIMLFVVCFLEQPWNLPFPSIQTWLALVALAMLGTVLAYLVYFRLLASTEGSNVMLVTLLIPISALMLGNLFLNEPLHIHELVGAAIIGLGLLVIDGRLPRIVRSRIIRLSKRLGILS